MAFARASIAPRDGVAAAEKVRLAESGDDEVRKIFALNISTNYITEVLGAEINSPGSTALLPDIQRAPSSQVPLDARHPSRPMSI